MDSGLAIFWLSILFGLKGLDRRGCPQRALRTLPLVEAVPRDPFDGPGKPERLRGQLSGNWSRRIDQEHRLVYRVEGHRVFFLAARFHY